jgi:lysine 2,3-aminomutase
MTKWSPVAKYTREKLVEEAGQLLETLKDCQSREKARESIFNWLTRVELADEPAADRDLMPGELVRRRDCILALTGIVRPSSDELAGFSVTQALWDIARGEPRDDLETGFFADLIHIFQGILGCSPFRAPESSLTTDNLSGREASLVRSEELDQIWSEAEASMSRYPDGLLPESVQRRAERKEEILRALHGQLEDWNDWKWHVRHVATDAGQISKLVVLSDEEKEALQRANQCSLPVGVTPYYASLMDRASSGRDRAIRAQVLPPRSYVDEMSLHRDDRKEAFDFMGEYDTSPVDLVTRRYPAILILKPYNTCPQICVYCQRNWEIDEAMAPGAMAPRKKIDEALQWIEDHPSIREVLVTGGDPLIMSNGRINDILSRLAANSNLDVIRIGSRIPVTLPMRMTDDLATLLGSFRKPGKREICLVTHVEHPYEITPEMVQAVDKLKRQGISVFNQQVYTFFVSRRFETARLRMLLRRIGIDPYYTFVTKGKEETHDYRVPVARLLQEQKEESRLLPGIRRTDEVVYNVPRLGKNHVRAFQHRSLLSVNAEGVRIYEFHPWEKNVIQRKSYVGEDVSILEYLDRLAAIGEDPQDYLSIWYYY